MQENEYSPYESSIAQQVLCKDKGFPLFAPKSGTCCNCRKNIYQRLESREGRITGITTIKATTQLITGCPHCNRSYCD